LRLKRRQEKRVYQFLDGVTGRERNSRHQDTGMTIVSPAPPLWGSEILLVTEIETKTAKGPLVLEADPGLRDAAAGSWDLPVQLILIGMYQGLQAGVTVAQASRDGVQLGSATKAEIEIGTGTGTGIGIEKADDLGTTRGLDAGAEVGAAAEVAEGTEAGIRRGLGQEVGVVVHTNGEKELRRENGVEVEIGIERGIGTGTGIGIRIVTGTGTGTGIGIGDAGAGAGAEIEIETGREVVVLAAGESPKEIESRCIR
jgi:hypothetical protein